MLVSTLHRTKNNIDTWGVTEDTGDMDDPNGDQKTTSSLDVLSVPCSICLDLVKDNGDRSIAKLQCGHEFHLDCIGSAFNVKGAMQCPNCRKVERGQWLFASSSTRTFPEFAMDEWTPDDYALNYSEMPLGVHWCPFSGLAQLQSAFEEVESASSYHNLQRQHHHHPIFSEHTSPSSLAHSYVAFLGSIPPSSSSSSSNVNENVEDPNFNHHWNGLSGQNEIFNAHSFPVQYQSWGHHSSSYPVILSSGHINRTDRSSSVTLRPTGSEYDSMTRSGSVVQPPSFHGHRRRSHERTSSSPHANVASHPQRQLSTIPVVVRSNNGGGLRGSLASDQSGGFFNFLPPSSSRRNPHESENPSTTNHIHARDDRNNHLGLFPPVVSSSSSHGESVWGSFRQAPGGGGGGFDSANRSGNFWNRHYRRS